MSPSGQNVMIVPVLSVFSPLVTGPVGSLTA
jgi:hypothetical protein